MPRNRRDLQPVEIRRLTLEDIERGIARLRRRIEDTRLLKPTGLARQLAMQTRPDLQVRHDDQRVRNVEQKIEADVAEIFGPNSPEVHANRFFSIWRGPHVVGMGDDEAQSCFEAGIPQTITMLEGLIANLEERKVELGTNATARTHATFQGMPLHPRLAAAAANLVRDGHYRNAVLDACVALVNYVKERSGRQDLDGANLMRTVFSRNNPVLAFNDLADQTQADEQEGFMHLFEGAVLALRNPRAHSLTDDDPTQALEYLALLSLLAKRLEAARRVATP
jgi:uncharacterized protein (TIGR02391 family)